MIYLYTGMPGHGKTVRAIFDLLHDDRFKGRAVYARNIRGLKYDHPRLKDWQALNDLTQWQQLPPGAIVLVDECHKDFPTRATGAQVPEHIKAMAEHRHLGIDFILITQHPGNMDVFVRRLTEQTVHVRRTAQMGFTSVFTFQNFTDCDPKPPVQDALKTDRWRYDKNIFDLYDSTELNTTKAKIPRQLKIMALLFFGLGLLLYVSYKSINNFVSNDAESPDQTIVGPVKSESNVKPFDAFEHVVKFSRSVSDYKQNRVPRDAVAPESAPIYDALTKPISFPRVAGCIRKGADCKCFTQQATIVHVPEATCYEIVQVGRFNPYFDERAERQRWERLATAQQALAANNAAQTAIHTQATHPATGEQIATRNLLHNNENGTQQAGRD